MNSESFRWHAGWRYAGTLPERNTKTPLTRASWLMLFCFAPMKEIHSASKLLTWTECFYRKEKKNMPGSLIEAKILQCKSLDDLGSGICRGHPSRFCTEWSNLLWNHSAEWNWITHLTRLHVFAERALTWLRCDMHIFLSAASVYLHFLGYVPPLRALFRCHWGTPLCAVSLDWCWILNSDLSFFWESVWVREINMK